MRRAMTCAFGLLMTATAVASSEECAWLGDTVTCRETRSTAAATPASDAAVAHDAIPNISVKSGSGQPAELIEVGTLADSPDGTILMQKVVSDILSAPVGTQTSGANPGVEGVPSDGVACAALADTTVCN